MVEMRRIVASGIVALACALAMRDTSTHALERPQPTASRSRTADRRATPSRAAQKPTLLPGTKPTAFSTIRGTAVNVSNGAAIGKATIRLRDIRMGRIVDTTTTDVKGQFTFSTVDPG